MFIAGSKQFTPVSEIYYCYCGQHGFLMATELDVKWLKDMLGLQILYESYFIITVGQASSFLNLVKYVHISNNCAVLKGFSLCCQSCT